MDTASGNINVECIELLEDAVDSSVEQLFKTLEGQHPQLGLDWLLNLSRHALEVGDRAIVLVARGSGSDMAVVPLKLSANGSAHALGNFYTSFYQPGCTAAESLPLYTAALRHLAKDLRSDSLTLAPMDAEHDTFNSLQRALAEAGWRGVHPYFCFGNWIHNTDTNDWDSYLRTRPSRLRNTLSRKTRKLLRDERGALSIITGGGELEEAISAYTAIYNRSWKRDEPYTEFTPALIRLAAERGWLRLGLAHYDGKPIAAQIWLINGRAAYIFKLAYDGDYSELSPGTVLTAHLLQHALENDGVTCIDYLSGDDAYKRDWMSERRERHGLAAYNPRTVRGLAQLCWHLLKRTVRRDAD